MYLLRSTCRSCDGAGLEPVLSLGELPLPDALLLPRELDAPQRRYPLDVALCERCGLLQLTETVSPAEVFDEHYRCLTSASASYLAHLSESAEHLVQQRGLDGNSSVIEIGSNDGSMLRCFQARGVPTLGIDPAPGGCTEARRAGIATLPAFFSKELAQQLVADGRAADVVIANDVLPLVPDVHGFLAGVRTLLQETGIAVMEVPYAGDPPGEADFDTFGHGRLCYFSLTSLVVLFEGCGLCINHVERYPTRGGLLRLFISRSRRNEPSVTRLLEAEKARGVSDARSCAAIGVRAEQTRARLRALLEGHKAQGKRIAGYGAGARASTVLNYCGIDDRYLDYVVDGNPQKQGRFLPGVQLPVLHPDRLVSNRPDYVLVLDRDAWEEAACRHRCAARAIFPRPEPAVC